MSEQVSPSLRIRAAKVDGKYQFYSRFDSSKRVFVLKGDNSSGKSTFMNLLYFGLGGGDRADYIPELAECRDVWLEVSIGADVFTFRRSISVRPSLIYVHRGTLETFKDDAATQYSTDGRVVSELFQDFIMGALQLRDRPVISKKTGRKSRLTWSQLLSLVYVDQDTPANAIYRNAAMESAEVKRKRLEVVFDIDRDELDELENQLVSMELEQKKQKADLDAITRFLTDLGLDLEGGLLELTKLMNDVGTKRSNVSQTIREIKASMRTSSTHLDDVRIHLAGLTEELRRVENESLVYLNRVQDYERLLNELTTERERIQAHGVVADVLPGLNLDTCPGCFQHISHTKHEEHTCPICRQDLEPHSMDELTVEDRLKVLDDKVKDIKATLQAETAELQALTGRRRLVIDEKRRLERVLNEQTTEMISPFLNEIENLHDHLRDLDKEGENLQSKLRAYDKADLYRKDLHSLEEKVKQTRSRAKHLREAMQRLLTLYLGAMDNAFFNFLDGTVLPQMVSARIDSETLLPIINEGRPKLSASDRVVIRLAFFYSLLAAAVLTDAKHPKLLLLDSPRDKDMDWPKFEAIMNSFSTLAKYADVDCQIFITTSEVTADISDDIFLYTKDAENQRFLKKSSVEDTKS